MQITCMKLTPNIRGTDYTQVLHCIPRYGPTCVGLGLIV